MNILWNFLYSPGNTRLSQNGQIPESAYCFKFGIADKMHLHHNYSHLLFMIAGFLSRIYFLVLYYKLSHYLRFYHLVTIKWSSISQLSSTTNHAGWSYIYPFACIVAMARTLGLHQSVDPPFAYWLRHCLYQPFPSKSWPTPHTLQNFHNLSKDLFLYRVWKHFIFMSLICAHDNWIRSHFLSIH